ncbi:MAG: hypothetical protein R3E01_29080 [Pirellulaceae bacterium]
MKNSLKIKLAALGLIGAALLFLVTGPGQRLLQNARALVPRPEPKFDPRQITGYINDEGIEEELLEGELEGDAIKVQLPLSPGVAAELRVIHQLPESPLEIATLHERNRVNNCELISEDEPVELTSFTPYLTARDERMASVRAPIPSTRQELFTVGLEMMRSDHATLPTVSRRQILSYMGEHYVSVQARVQRDPASGQLFLHHRPLAATVRYRGASITQPFHQAVTTSVQEMHSLGLYLPEGADVTAENLRTLVMTHRNIQLETLATLTDLRRARPDYEYVFVRARPGRTADDRLETHTFATTEHRTRLHYVSPSNDPIQVAQCGIAGTVVFTEFSQGVYPVNAVIRKTSVRSRATYPMDSLDAYASSQGWEGRALAHLNETLDAIIDGKVSFDAPDLATPDLATPEAANYDATAPK